MTAFHAKSSPHGERRQRGAALVTVLVLLLVMTLLGLASVRSTLLEERMSANVYDRSLGFQAAEAALRDGENLAAGRPAVPTTGCTAGLCGVPDVNADVPVWENATVWAAAPQSTVDLGTGVVATPQYVVELIADGVPARGACTTTGDVSGVECTGSERRYRVTARSTESGRSAVMLQSIYAVP